VEAPDSELIIDIIKPGIIPPKIGPDNITNTKVPGIPNAWRLI
jgi:hypothetical protein